MAIITSIDGIPLYSTQQEALTYAQENGLDGFHTHIFQGQTGYMGGKDHNNAVTGVGMPRSNEKIILNKRLYSRSDVSNNIDLSFSELLNVDNRSDDVKIKNFFQEYNNLFYDIPKIGEQSHSTLFQQSRDYVNDFYDPKDDQIDALLERIETLEDDLLESTSTTITEHPVYNDGTFLKVNGNATIYFMYKGKACEVGDTGTPSAYDILAKKYYPYLYSNSFNGDKFEVVIEVDSADSLPPTGPTLKDGKDINRIDDLIQAYLR
tara:strand:+ start:285 stop:1076 length:792 start_codon:yes stop_codon:yes gene_type:complete